MPADASSPGPQDAAWVATEGPAAGASDTEPNGPAPTRPGDPVILCGACTRRGSCRLGVEREQLRRWDTAVFDLHCPRDQEGGPEVAHGGWIAAVLDECGGHLPLLNNVMSVTAELTVNFVKPVPVQRALQARAWVDRREGSRWYIGVELMLLPGRAVLATASGIWVTRDKGHFDRHRAWLAEQDTAGSDQA
ncbi:PaaI family thioesterase [Nocardia vinacea]|uniref:Acyl-coenzyme A thioesterase THEM4 n=1 Tax=Nocardia vinacea TaxID=96468 RepID=A0ABZ1YUT0_9NOCA|nr:PaaI family thioesterase [Nocardia vinacea]